MAHFLWSLRLPVKDLTRKENIWSVSKPLWTKALFSYKILVEKISLLSIKKQFLYVHENAFPLASSNKSDEYGLMYPA